MESDPDVNGRRSESAGRWVLAAAILGSSISFIDGTVVNVALPILQRDLDATVGQTQWVVESYALMLSALILVGGSLGDLFGRKKIFSIGVFVFGVASVLCGIAQDANQLIVVRGVQGIGAAMLVPGSLALISANFSEKKRGRADRDLVGADRDRGRCRAGPRRMADRDFLMALDLFYQCAAGRGCAPYNFISRSREQRR